MNGEEGQYNKGGGNTFIFMIKFKTLRVESG